jgi:hypothetical protein
MHRATDREPKSYFQTDRFFRSEGMWYFSTREGIDFGPFTIKIDGEKALRRYIDTQKTMQRLRRRDPTLNEERQWNDQSVANAASDVAKWRLDRNSRPDSMYVDRDERHK